MDAGKPVSIGRVLMEAMDVEELVSIGRVLMGAMNVGNSLRKVAGRPPVGMAEGLMGSGVPEEVEVETVAGLLGIAESLFSSSHGVFAGGAADDAGVVLPTEGTLGVGDAGLEACAG
jgi:hypothetical protein